MPQCVHNTRAGTRCRFNARPGTDACGHHTVNYVVNAVIPVPCAYGGIPCPHPLRPGSIMCAHHDDIRNTIIRTIADLQRTNELGARLDIFSDYVLARYHVTLPPHGELAQFAHDGQNVHTTIVTEATNRGLEELLALPVDKGSNYVFNYIESVLLTIDLLETDEVEYARIADVVLPDLKKWYTRPTCREAGDKLFNRLVKGVFTKIQTYPKDMQKEFWKRFEQEATDSVGMCCDGHITRMVNVFAGIDPAFVPVVSVGEQLQNRMAAIAAGDDTTAEKIRLATEVMNELHVPEIERNAWIEAF